MYNIDLNRLIKLLLPVRLRKMTQIAWLSALISPVSRLYNTFIIARQNDLFRHSIDSTVPRLEYMLNTLFYAQGLTDNYRIIIGPVEVRRPTHIYLQGIVSVLDEAQPVFIYQQIEAQPVYLFTANELGTGTTDFWVKVPHGVEYDTAAMTSWVREFCLPDKNFQIIEY